ncbi:hypothetical protein KY361_00210 [Candidatus Woesearchaeota archaeon]|nr:hypothetical protein [Candidatus Woesearchaeota archaeon]
MKPISKENNRKTYIVNLSLALMFLSVYVWKEQSVFLVVAVAFIALALWRKHVLDKILV